MTLKLEKALRLTERSTAFIKKRGEIWYAGRETGKLNRRDEKSEEANEESVLPDFSIADGGMAQRGDHLYTASAAERVLYVTDMRNRERRALMDLKTIPGGTNTGGLRAKNSEVTDIAVNGDLLWIAVEAGYSSCIVQVDLEGKKIVGDFWSPGPKPYGLDFDSHERLWVLDGRSNGLVQGSKKGEWYDEPEELPVPEARYLNIDESDAFWTTNVKKSQLYCVRREA